jgi:hypothetical protein
MLPVVYVVRLQLASRIAFGAVVLLVFVDSAGSSTAGPWGWVVMI